VGSKITFGVVERISSGDLNDESTIQTIGTSVQSRISAKSA
jgi:hypothetical protein